MVKSNESAHAKRPHASTVQAKVMGSQAIRNFDRAPAVKGLLRTGTIPRSPKYGQASLAG